MKDIIDLISKSKNLLEERNISSFLEQAQKTKTLDPETINKVKSSVIQLKEHFKTFEDLKKILDNKQIDLNKLNQKLNDKGQDITQTVDSIQETIQTISSTIKSIQEVYEQIQFIMMFLGGIMHFVPGLGYFSFI